MAFRRRLGGVIGGTQYKVLAHLDGELTSQRCSHTRAESALARLLLVRALHALDARPVGCKPQTPIYNLDYYSREQEGAQMLPT